MEGPELATAQGSTTKGNLPFIPAPTISALPDPHEVNAKAPQDDGHWLAGRDTEGRANNDFKALP